MFCISTDYKYNKKGLKVIKLSALLELIKLDYSLITLNVLFTLSAVTFTM